MKQKINNLIKRLDYLQTLKKETKNSICDLTGFHFSPYPDENTIPPSPHLIGCLLYLLDVDGGYLHENLIYYTFGCSKDDEYDKLVDEDKKVKSDNPNDFKTLYYQSSAWCRAFEGSYKKPYLGVFPISKENRDKILELNKTYIRTCIELNNSELDTYVVKFIIESKDNFLYIQNKYGEKLLKYIGFFGFRTYSGIEKHWNGTELLTDEALEKCKNSYDKTLITEIGTINVGYDDVPSGTYLQDTCGCILKTLSKAEMSAKDLRRGARLHSALTGFHPYLKMVRPSDKCLVKLRLRKYRYALGAHSMPIGSARWSFDKHYTIVAKPEKMSSRATKDSHPELEVDWI